MPLVKNTFGVSLVLSPHISNWDKLNSFGGSSLDRVKTPTKRKDPAEQKENEVKEPKLRSMSNRTKAKIRTKLIAFAQVHQKLTFVTLTFVNQVEDKKAVKVLKAFLDNATKRLQDFQYLWVAEKQTKNLVFKNNIHFHLVTNKYWKREKWWNYWLDIQAKHGIKPREAHFKPASAFDARVIRNDNTKGMGSYLTKYITKNASEFGCQVWNCSKKLSRLYTSFYSDLGIITQFEKLQAAGLLDGEIKTYKQDFCNVNIIPINKLVMKFYEPIARENKENWNQ